MGASAQVSNRVWIDNMPNHGMVLVASDAAVHAT
jgi:hypothetical protein